MKDYYKILEIKTSASSEEIKRSYRRLALKYHPDRNFGSIECNRLFTDINQAYKTLSNEESRKRYDSTYKIRIAREIRPVTPQLFLEKFQNIRQFIFAKGRRKISQVALHRGLTNLLSDNNIKYLHSENNASINKQIIKEVLKCCDFLPETEMLEITGKLMLLVDSEEKMIQAYIKNHKTVKPTSTGIIDMLVNITHKVTTIFR